MDCAKCDPLLIDELYGELDEVTSAAVRRHVAGCAQCSEAWRKISRGKELAGAISEQVPEGLETKILDAAKEAQKVVPIRSRGSRALSWAGSWAMRPQTAMAALFLLMIGSSAVYLGRGANPPMASQATSEGFAIERDRAEQASAPALAEPAASALATTALPNAAPPPAEEFARAKGSAAGAKREAAKEVAKDDLVLGLAAQESKSAPKAPAAAPMKSMADNEAFGGSGSSGASGGTLAEARRTREQQGCPSAVSRYDAIAAQSPGTPEAATALFEAAKCYESFGDYSAARTRFQKLSGTAYAAQAKAELDNMDMIVKNKGGSVVAGGNAAPKRAASPAPATETSGSEKKKAPAIHNTTE